MQRWSSDLAGLRETLRVLAADVAQSARAEGVAGRTVTLKVRCAHARGPRD